MRTGGGNPSLSFMAQLQELISDDSRSLLEKCKRRELELVAQHLDLRYKPGIGAIDLRKLIEGSGATQEDVFTAITWDQVTVKNEDGSTNVVPYPHKKPHATALKDIDYDSAIEQQAKKHDKELEDKDAIIAQLQKQIDVILEKLGEQKPEPNWPDNRHLMHLSTLKKKCRELGLSFDKKAKKADILELLDGYFASGNEQSSEASEHSDG